jgi:hypothetical protein
LGVRPISVNLFEASRKTFVLATYARVAALRGLSQCFANYQSCGGGRVLAG